mgnify:FL=1
MRQKNIKFNNHLGFLIKNSFTWINVINEVFYEHFSKYDLEKYISDDLISYLFKNKVNLHRKYRYIIPYLISITNTMYNITEYRDDNNNRFFGLIKLMRAWKNKYYIFNVLIILIISLLYLS